MMSSRRVFLSQSALAAGAAFNSNLLRAAIGPGPVGTGSAGKIPTRDTVLKYFPDGRPTIFKGNTVICHVLEQSEVHDAITVVRTDLLAASFTRKVALLAPESYHMTIYPEINDQDRNITGWPSYLAPGASIEECNKAVASGCSSPACHSPSA